MRIRWFIIAITVIAVVSLLFISFTGSTIDQPIKYNHSKHVEEIGLECIQCHQHYETDSAAGLPVLEDCTECHSELLGESEEEKKLLQFVDENLEVPWNRVFQLPRHVFFSHRRHIVLGQLECNICHGDMEKLTEPPQKSDNEVTMDFCIECHEDTGVSIDCMNCHR